MILKKNDRAKMINSKAKTYLDMFLLGNPMHGFQRDLYITIIDFLECITDMNSNILQEMLLKIEHSWFYIDRKEMKKDVYLDKIKSKINYVNCTEKQRKEFISILEEINLFEHMQTGG